MKAILLSTLLLLLVQTAFSQQQSGTANGGSCSTEEMRLAAVDKALASIGCDDYNCATTRVFPGLDASNPASSCAEILNARPSAPSGDYWLEGMGGAAVQVYCDMSITCQGVGGGWMRVVDFNFTDPSQDCPTDTVESRSTPIRVCGINSFGAACSSATFEVQGVNYNRVCGKIIGYQEGLTDAFNPRPGEVVTIDGHYVDGVSLTHGSNPRQHIWTFASARDEVGQFPHTICQCTNTTLSASATPAPNFVGNDYFCDTGSTLRSDSSTFYLDDPLWDGAGCGPQDSCCSLNNPPWFQKQLPTATRDDIEMRICRDDHQTDEKIHVQTVEIYIQ